MSSHEREVGHKRWALRVAWDLGPFAAAGLMYGVLTALAFAPFGLWGFAVVAPWPLVWAAWRGARGGESREQRGRSNLGGTKRLWWAAVGVGTAPFWAIEHLWVVDVSAVGYPFLVVLMSVYPAMFVWSAAWAMRRLPRWPLTVIVPIAWVGVEYLRGSVVWTGYPWYLAGQPLIDAPGVWCVASWGGAYAASLMVAMIAGAAADGAVWWRNRLQSGKGGVCHGVRRRGAWALGGCSVVIVVWLLAVVGSVVSERQRTQDRAFRVGIAQPNIPMDDRILWDGRARVQAWLDLQELTLAAARARPDLIVWPETVFPGGPLNKEAAEAQREAGMVWLVQVQGGESETVPAWAFAEALEELQADLGVPMLVGAVAVEGLRFVEFGDGFRDEYDRRFNSVFLVDGGRVDAKRYDKLHLTPFGEVMPYISSWPWLERQMLAVGARGMSFDLAPGREARVFSVRRSGGQSDDAVRVVTPICFEATMSRVCRRLVFERGERRAEVMVNVTNDGWFGFADWGREHHLLGARWRCAELATPMIRAANTGISAVIDARGQVRDATGERHMLTARAAGVLVAEVAPGELVTVYARLGDVVGQGSLALWMVGVGVLVASEVRRGRYKQGRDVKGAADRTDGHTKATRESGDDEAMA